MDGDYINGFVERKSDGRYEGKVAIDGIQLEDIEAVYFKQEDKQYLWLKRKPLLEYNQKTQSFKKRERRPQWQAYLEKQIDNNTVAYKGEFAFLRFKYSIVGIWDRILGKEKQRLNLFVERLPMSQQTILNAINERKIAHEKNEQRNT